ncbi:alpha/beta-hydrolase, partial [Auricularia subglabra TFB-10046 SS5]
MRLLRTLSLLLSASVNLLGRAHATGPIVDLGYAKVLGTTAHGDSPVAFFGGIPYARPPLEDLRFRAPQRLNETVVPESHRPLLNATDWGSPCIQQPADLSAPSGESEGEYYRLSFPYCLKLNIWAPAGTKAGSRLPVAFYIYAGGLYAGTARGFPLQDWVSGPTKIVGVNFGYRLNVLGFLSGPPGVDANAGLLDQRAAMEWVQRHISKFGGDPEQITIIGESAGGASVVMHVVSHGGTKPVPFKRAVAQSIGYGPTQTPEEAQAWFVNISTTAGCPSSGPTALNCLRSAPLENIVRAINGVPTGRPSAVVDGDFLPALPSRLLAEGRFARVEVVAGHCANDGRTFAGGRPEDFVTNADIATRVFGRWGTHVTNGTIQKALALYSPEKFESQYERAWTMAQEIIFGCMDWLLADRMRAKGVQNVFTFRFNSPNAVLYKANPYLGVMHTSDLYYLFNGTTSAPNAGYTFTPLNKTEKALSQEAIRYWTSFVAAGSPSADRLRSSPAWPSFSQ